MPEINGMRPQDVVVLLKLASYAQQGQPGWQQVPLAASLGLSQAEVSNSLGRSRTAHLLAADKRQLRPAALLEFLSYGLRYVFPAEPGAVVRGLPTAHSAPPLAQLIRGEADAYVWADATAEGTVRGAAVDPLYASVPFAARQDECLYELLALTDTLRVGRPREVALAQQLLKERLLP